MARKGRCLVLSWRSHALQGPCLCFCESPCKRSRGWRGAPPRGAQSPASPLIFGLFELGLVKPLPAFHTLRPARGRGETCGRAASAGGGIAPPSAPRACSGPTEEEEPGAEMRLAERRSRQRSAVAERSAEGVLRLARVWRFSSAECC